MLYAIAKGHSQLQNEKILSQIVGVSKVCNQNGDMLSEKDQVAIFAIYIWK